MNQQNAKEYLPLVQALADGKTLQVEDYAGWVDLREEINSIQRTIGSSLSHARLIYG